jgi:hypothetical protein
VDQNRYPALRLRCGAARDVAAPWSSSSDSRPLKHGFVPHRWEPDNARDSIFLISDIRRAPARLLDVYPSIDQRARNTASPATDLPPFTAVSLGKPLSPQCPSPPGHSVPHQKPIAAEFQTASFKSLYRKRSGNQESHLSSSLICRSVSDTALGLVGNLTGRRGSLHAIRARAVYFRPYRPCFLHLRRSAAAGSDLIENAGSQPPVKPAKCVREHERHDQDPRPQDGYVQGPAQIEAADTTDQHVASGEIEQAP